MLNYDILRFGEINSTNSFALENAKQCRNRQIILADRQTGGRGRFQRKWVSGEGGLYFTIALKPENIKHLPNFTQAMCVAACETLALFNLRPQIKWPNDVLIDGKKICGILAETSFEGSKLSVCALGVGVNLEQSEKDLTETGKPACSVFSLTAKKPERDKFLTDLLDIFFPLYDKAEKNGFAAIRANYLKFFNLPKENADATDGAGNSITIKPLALDDDGHLIAEHNGQKITLTAGEINEQKN